MLTPSKPAALSGRCKNMQGWEMHSGANSTQRKNIHTHSETVGESAGPDRPCPGGGPCTDLHNMAGWQLPASLERPQLSSAGGCRTRPPAPQYPRAQSTTRSRGGGVPLSTHCLLCTICGHQGAGLRAVFEGGCKQSGANFEPTRFKEQSITASCTCTGFHCPQRWPPALRPRALLPGHPPLRTCSTAVAMLVIELQA